MRRTSSRISASGLSAELFEANLEAVTCLIPDLAEKVDGMAPNLLGCLVRNPDILAQRLMELRELVPAANASHIVAQRPSVVTDPEWQSVADASEKLTALLDDPKVVGRIVEQYPAILTENVDDVVENIQKMMPDEDPAEILRNNPGVLQTAMMSRRISGRSPRTW